MKKGISMLVALLALLFVSCSTDSVDNRDQFTGNYNATNSIYSQDSLHTYSLDSLQVLNKYILTITKSANESKEILLSNFEGDSITIKALVSGSNFTIVPDTINKNIYSGTGTISKSNLSMNIWIKSIQNDGYTNYIDAGVKN
jgi:uncharacterized protein YpuA (DUF1002 family)